MTVATRFKGTDIETEHVELMDQPHKLFFTICRDMIKIPEEKIRRMSVTEDKNYVLKAHGFSVHYNVEEQILSVGEVIEGVLEMGEYTKEKVEYTPSYVYLHRWNENCLMIGLTDDKSVVYREAKI